MTSRVSNRPVRRAASSIRPKAGGKTKYETNHGHQKPGCTEEAAMITAHLGVEEKKLKKRSFEKKEVAFFADIAVT